eukprot:CAMPEP_0201093798 /NCGR_PEP_ID=MMETSP0812-20130820/2231_1 /ASSEMBLY_ACC=CAM_ASM_000668 /TAXON_ID=98059 /ORGANISM="Dinobryon sp., Strain UTEXLB2267" /LENGTH=848 /DNA_ID=CAMNT_0047346113 /DNA_START=230 /DNA_END=2775 /DNA_ORIENTATION=+
MRIFIKELFHFMFLKLEVLDTAFVIELSSALDGHLQHATLLDLYGQESYGIIDSHHAILVAKIDDILSHYIKTKEKSGHSNGLISRYMLMLPEIKFDPSIKEILSSTTRNDSIAIQILLSPFEEKSSHEDFLSFIHKQNNQVSFLLQYEADDQDSIENDFEDSDKNSFLRRRTLMTLRFNKHEFDGDGTAFSEAVRLVVQKVANRREVLWVESATEVIHHNRWANGICDTGDATNRPLEHNNLTGLNQIIGVTDTGVDMFNCYFYDPNNPTPFSSRGTKVNLKHRKVVQYVNYTDSFDDVEGHGTHVSGIAAGQAWNNYGDYKKYNGNANDAKLAIFDIGDVNSSIPGKGSLHPPQDYNYGIFRVLYRSGARVFSNSWGSSTTTYDSHTAQADSFMWDKTDALLVFSAGNTGCSSSCFMTVGSPANFKNGVTVGASLNDRQAWLAYYSSSAAGGAGDSQWDGPQYSFRSIASFSSKGPTPDKRLKPDVLATGWWATSAASAPGSTSEHCAVRGLRGTSMSTPQVAGFAARLRQYFTEGRYYLAGTVPAKRGFVPSGALLKAMLIHSGQPMSYIVNSSAANAPYTVLSTTAKSSSNSNHGYPSVVQGYGRIQMNKVLNFAGPASLYPLSLFVLGSSNKSQPHFASIRNNTQVDSYSFTTPSGVQHSIRITLCYSDYPSFSGTTNVMVNLLKLTVYHPRSGVVYSPYLPTGLTASNVQMVDLAAELLMPNTVYWVNVTVDSKKLAKAPQPYALVMTGKIVYLNDSFDSVYKVQTHSATYLTAGAVTYIAVLSVVAAVVVGAVCFFKGLSQQNKQSRSCCSRDKGSSSGNSTSNSSSFNSHSLDHSSPERQ